MIPIWDMKKEPGGTCDVVKTTKLLQQFKKQSSFQKEKIKKAKHWNNKQHKIVVALISLL